jgi:hypothetical protein
VANPYQNGKMRKLAIAKVKCGINPLIDNLRDEKMMKRGIFSKTNGSKDYSFQNQLELIKNSGSIKNEQILM